MKHKTNEDLTLVNEEMDKLLLNNKIDQPNANANVTWRHFSIIFINIIKNKSV